MNNPPNNPMLRIWIQFQVPG